MGVYRILLVPFYNVHYTEILKPKQSQVTQQATGSRDHQQPELINLKAMLSKLPVSLAANVNNVAVHIAVDRRAKCVYDTYMCNYTVCH